MKKVSDTKLLSSLRRISGPKEMKGPVVFSIMKNEQFFIRAFLDHYRSIGASHFLILDDGSDDGTKEFLSDQNDVTVYESEYSYGQIVKRKSLRFWRPQKIRAGIRFKALIPSAFFTGKWCVYADADEFLVLPAEYGGLASLLDGLDAAGIPLSIGAMVEMFPSSVSSLRNGIQRAESLSQLLTAYDHFDALPLLHVDNDGEVYRLNDSATGRLFRQFGVVAGPPLNVVRSVDGQLLSALKRLPIGSATQKIPLIKPSKNCYLLNSHKANAPLSPLIGLTILHFKFTYDSFRRIELAIKSKAWSRGSEKYTHYQQLTRNMGAEASFIGPDSVSLESYSQLEEVKNLWVNLPGDSTKQGVE